ncbi:MAG: hypothetical protein WD988_04410 [Candidatus Curtissbacteria bacterium]
MLKIIIALLVASILGLGIYKLIYKPSSTPVPYITSETSSATDKIKVVPINANKFQKTIVDADNCNNPVGLVVYEDKSTNSFMKINSTSLKHNPDITQGVNNLIKFLDQGKQSSFQEFNSLEMVFRNYCGGAAIIFVKDLPGIEYPGADQVRAIMTRLTQEPGGGTIFVVIYARIGENLIQLSNSVVASNLYRSHQEKCAKSNPEESTAMDNCYQGEISTDTNLEQLSIQTANNLVTTFAIK